MKITVKIVRNDGTEVLSTSKTLVEVDDFSRAVHEACNQFRKEMPNESLLDDCYNISITSSDS